MTAPKLINAQAISPTAIDLTFDQAMDQAELSQLGSYSVYPSIPGFELSTVVVVNSTAARILLKASMLEGGEYTATVSNTVKNKGGEALDLGFASRSFTGLGSQPSVSSCEALDARTIRVTFTEPVCPLALSQLQNFELTSETTGKVIPLSASSPVGQGNGLVYRTDLTISSSSKMTDGGLHTLAVSGICGVAGTPQLATSFASFVGVAELPKVLSVAFDELSNSAVVEFDTPIQRLGASALGSYALVSQEGVPQLYHSEILVAEDRRSLRVKLSEARNGALYLLAVSSDVVDDFGNPIDQAQNSGAFVAIGTLPVLLRAVSIGTNNLNLVFSKPLRDSAAIRDESRYSATGGLAILKVLSLEREVIKLATSDQLPGASYSISIS